MAMTVFACPKPLRSRYIETIQRNAIASWLRLPGSPEVILFGDEETAGLAADLGARYSSSIEFTETGAPLLDGLLPAAEELATGELLAYVNADIVLMSDFAAAVARVSRRRRPFLMVGRRVDLDVTGQLDFADGWEGRLRDRALREGTLNSHVAIDYFVFRPGLWGEIPSLAVGRATFDNWLLRRALDTGAALIDATPFVVAVHQNHPYDHVPGGKPEVYGGQEARRNMELAGGFDKLYFIHDATHMLTPRLLLPAVAPRYLLQRWRRWSKWSPELSFPRRALLWTRRRVRRSLGRLA
jgi:hypothetical protein